MKRNLIILFSLFLLSCSSDNIGDSYSFEFYKKSNLEVREVENSYMKYGNISEGGNLVFKFSFIAAEEESIADDEYSEYIYFEINQGLNSFSVEGEDLLLAKTILTKSCFCFFADDIEKNVSPIGAISGKKISNNKWKITFDVIFYGNESRSFEEIFTLK